MTVDMIKKFVKLDYKINGESINYRIELVSVPSNLGKGSVFYFVCPVTRRRCRKLYLIGKYFLSRFAFPSALYTKQTQAKSWRHLSRAFDVLNLRDERIDFIAKRYAKTWYKGKPTKRFQRILDREERACDRFSKDIPAYFTYQNQ